MKTTHPPARLFAMLLLAALCLCPLLAHAQQPPLVAWGWNSDGQLGDATTQQRTTATPVQPGALAGKTIAAIAAGSNHTLALTTDGKLYTWGWNTFGVLGTGQTPAQSSVPVAVDMSGFLAGKTITAITAGVTHNIALASDGSLFAWGNNLSGQLGIGGGSSQSLLPVPVNGGALAGKTVLRIASGASHNLALCSDGSLVAWGINNHGQLGDGSLAASPLPVLVDAAALAGKTITALAAGNGHSIALCSDGALASWGRNDSGQLGDGTTNPRLVPTLVPLAGALTGTTVTAIASGNHHSLALCANGVLAAWGFNAHGQLGDNTTTTRLSPVAISQMGALAGKTISHLAAGDSHSLALASDGALCSWGRNSEGQLGVNNLVSSPVPLIVPAGTLPPNHIFAKPFSSPGAHHSLALTAPACVPQMLVRGLSVTILDGDTTPTGGDHTDFFSASVCGNQSISHTFTVFNFGQCPLTVSAISSSNPAEFSINAPSFPIIIPAGGSWTDFSVTFAPNGPGARTATIHLESDDTSTSPYTFVVGGVGAGDELAVLGGSPAIAIADGDLSPSTADGTAFGAVVVNGASQPHLFTVTNMGGANLTITAIASSNPLEFQLAAPTLPLSIPPGGTLAIQVTFAPTSAGSKTGLLLLSTSDCQAAHHFAVAGEALAQCVQINCVPGKTVACGDSWDFDAPEIILSPQCANLPVTFTTVTNSLAPLVVTRTWTVSASAASPGWSCSQTVTVAPDLAFFPATIHSPNLTAYSSPGGHGHINVFTAAANQGSVYGSQLWLASFPSLFPSANHGWATPAESAHIVGAGNFSITIDLASYHNLTPEFVFGFYNIRDQGTYSIKAYDASGALISPPFSWNLLGNDDDALHPAASTHLAMDSATGLFSTQFYQQGYHSDAIFWNNIPANTAKIVITAALHQIMNNQDGVGVFFAERVLPFECPPNKEVVAGEAWEFDAPSPLGGGANLSITTIGTVTNQLSCGSEYIRAWQVVDSCGNTFVCSQSVRVSAPFNFFPAATTGSASSQYTNPHGDGHITVTGQAGPGLSQISFQYMFNSAFPDLFPVANTNWSFPAQSPLMVGVGNFTLTIDLTQYPGRTPDFVMGFYNVRENGVYSIAAYNSAGVLIAPPFTGNFLGNAEDALHPGNSTHLLLNQNTGQFFTQFYQPGSQSDAAFWNNIPTDTATIVITGNRQQTVNNQDCLFLFFGDRASQIECPPDKTVNFGQTWDFDPPTSIGGGTNLVFSTLTTSTNLLDCGMQVTRVWSVTDACGVQTTCSQTVTIVGSALPTFVCAPDKTVSCGSAWSFDAPVGTDHCGGTNNIPFTVFSTVTNSICPLVITRTWQLEGASVMCSQTVTVMPAVTLAPPPNSGVISGPIYNPANGHYYYLLAENTWTASQAQAVALGGHLATVNDQTENNWIYAQFSQFGGVNRGLWIGLNDAALEGPNNFVWVSGEPVTYLNWGTGEPVNQNGLDDYVHLFWPGDARQSQWNDNWDMVFDVASAGVSVNGVVEVGNFPPSLACAPNKNVDCGSVWEFDPPVSANSCNGQDVIVTVLSTVTNASPVLCPTTITRTWLVTDSCGNTNMCSQSVTIMDSTPPTLVCAPNKTVSCGSVWEFEAPVATDSCGRPVNVVVLGTVTNAAGVITRTWQASDACGNIAVCSQSVTVQNTGPTLSCAEDKSVQCGQDWQFNPPVPSSAGAVVSILSTVTNGVCPVTITRTWAMPDGCGGTNICSQTVTIIDTTPPVVICPTNKTVLAGSAWQFDLPVASDACCGDKPAIRPLTTITNGFCPQVITRRWEISDCCGNTTFCSQTVTVEDRTPPVWNPTTFSVVDILVDVKPWDRPIGVIHSGVAFGQTFTSSGGVLTHVDLFLGRDGATARPANLLLELRNRDGIPQDGPPLARAVIDGDSISVMPGWLRVPLNGEIEVEPGHELAAILRLEDPASDARFNVYGTEDDSYTAGELLSRSPLGWASFGGGKFDLGIGLVLRPSICGRIRYVRCGMAWSWPATPTASDAVCGTNVTVAILNTVTNGVCPQTITRTWIATDCCGNTSTCSYTIVARNFKPVVVTGVSVVRGEIAFSIDTDLGARYVVQSKRSLTDDEWTPIYSFIGKGEVQQIAKELPLDRSRFFQVRVEETE